MITVLWVMTVAAIVAAAGALAGRNAVNAATNRVHLQRAFWAAAGCSARIESAIDVVLGSAKSYEAATELWRGLDAASLSIASVDTTECTVRLEAAGTRLDMNAASEEMLERLFVALGLNDSAPSLASALADWRDSDDVPHPLGAERDWYVAQRRELPRNAPLADIRELARVRGFETLRTLDSVLTAEPGRVSLATASATVLRAVPGITAESADEIVSLQRSGTPVGDVSAIVGLVSRSSADSIRAHYADVARVTTPDPDAWLLTASATIGAPPVTVTLTHRLLRDAKRAVVSESRSNP
jgi:general secretion pathway protein K